MSEKQRKVFVVLTNINGDKLRDVIYLVLEAESENDAKEFTIAEILESAPVEDLDEARQMFEEGFYIEEMNVNKVEKKK